MRIPLFPLHTVILPGGQLPLRIFEPRYLDMLSECFRDSSGFGVCLIREGKEAGGLAVPYSTGTLVQIADWDKGHDGLLNVSVEGIQKFALQSTEVMPDNLLMGEVELLELECSCPLPENKRGLSTLLEQVFEQTGRSTDLSQARLADALWVGSRLLELLPMPGQLRQSLFECENPLDRLEGLVAHVVI
jgi:Lon protease-like protein